MTLLLVAVLLATQSSSFVRGSQEWIPGNQCLFISRQSYSQVLLFNEFSLDAHGDHFDPIGAFDTNPNPTGIASHKNLLYVGSYGRVPTKKSPERVPANIEIFDITKPSHEGGEVNHGGDAVVSKLKKVGDFSHMDEIKACYPESIVLYQGYLYVACGAVGQGILKIEVEKKFLKARIGLEQIPLSWGLTTRENYLYIASHCHEEDDAHEGLENFCEKAKHDAVWRPSFALICSLFSIFVTQPFPLFPFPASGFPRRFELCRPDT